MRKKVSSALFLTYETIVGNLLVTAIIQYHSFKCIAALSHNYSGKRALREEDAQQ